MLRTILTVFFLATYSLIAEELSSNGKAFFMQSKPIALRMGNQYGRQKQKSWAGKVKNNFRSPPPVKGISEARYYKKIYLNPTYTFKEDLKIGNKVIIKRGKSLNPLRKVSLSTRLLFFDGDKQEHISWAESNEGPFIWILVKGSPRALEKMQQSKGHPKNIFFDRRGFLCKRFGVKRIPCRVSQQGEKILVEEIPYWYEVALP